LFGGSVSRSRSGSLGTSGIGAMPIAAERHRRQSSATNSTTSLPRSNNGRDDDAEAEELGRGEKARMMNWRLDVYLTGNAERKPSMSQEVENIAPETSVPEQSGLARSGSIRRSGSLLGRKMKKGMRLSKTIFKG